MKIKIKNITIKGLRGVKKQIDLDLSGKSILLYGDNGTGKSSITDAFEWFYYDKVNHLSNEEIGRDGKEALRNTYLEETESAAIRIDFSDVGISSEKSLNIKKGKLVSENSNSEEKFLQYITESQEENLLLRYQDLRGFIDNSKTDKLKYFSDIIGFSEVTKVKDVIKKTFNAIRSEIKNGGYENQIQTQQSTLLSNIGANIYSENQLFDKLNELIKPLNTGIDINQFNDIETLIEIIKKPTDNQIIEKLNFLQKCWDLLTNIKKDITAINDHYLKYFKEFEKLFNDVESLKQKIFEELLNTGKHLLIQKYYTDNKCPLCLQDKNKQELISEIEDRLKIIELSKQKLTAFEKLQTDTKQIIENRIKQIDSTLTEKLIIEETHLELKESIEKIKSKLSVFISEINIKLLAGKRIRTIDEVKLTDSDLNYISFINEDILSIKETLKKDNSSDIRVKVEFAKNSFNQIKQLQTELQKLDQQKNNIEIIYNAFAKKQKEGLESFLNNFSTIINEYYQFMNVDEAFKDLKIIPIEDDEELKGITIQFKFNDKEVTPLQKYFSESHLNCYGLAFFLASVNAFNKENRFIILDDIISSFDSNHRKRFADLLFEKFNDYQIILLTHETQWYEYIRAIAKNKGWLLNKINCNEEKGTYLEESPEDIRERIVNNFKNNIETNLGNDIRIYLEFFIKQICYNLEAKVNYLPNETNEKRMAPEMLNALKSKIEKYNKTLIERTTNSNIIGNLLSHDNKYSSKIGDLKAFWKDILELENLFLCEDHDCKSRIVSFKNFDSVNKKIRCGCGKKEYDWKG
ncbi:MAG: AAA family ATPase [Bacteroidales bacterium]|nr:AAA family ATPase [Bacteroidales bacterium]